jgi:hypothetical protein
MNAVFSTFVLVIFVLATIWIGLFGTAGASVRSSDTNGRVKGFVIGALLGPIGLIWLIATRGRRRPVAQRTPLDTAPFTANPPTPTPSTPSAPPTTSGPAFDL